MKMNELEMINELQAKKEKLEQLDLKIKMKKEENKKFLIEEEKRLEKELSPQKQKHQEIVNEINDLGNNNVLVRLGDLVAELSKLTGIDILNMDISANIYESVSRTASSDMVEIIVSLYSSLIEDESKHQFIYEIRYQTREEEKQADGKLLSDHCSLGYSYTTRSGYSMVRILNRNIGELLCKIKIKNLIGKDHDKWYPVSLISKAILNCIEQEKCVSLEVKEKQKVLK